MSFGGSQRDCGLRASVHLCLRIIFMQEVGVQTQEYFCGLPNTSRVWVNRGPMDPTNFLWRSMTSQCWPVTFLYSCTGCFKSTCCIIIIWNYNQFSLHNTQALFISNCIAVLNLRQFSCSNECSCVALFVILPNDSCLSFRISLLLRLLFLPIILYQFQFTCLFIWANLRFQSMLSIVAGCLLFNSKLL